MTLDDLSANGQAVGGLPIIQGAAGYASLAGITAMVRRALETRPKLPSTRSALKSAGALA